VSAVGNIVKALEAESEKAVRDNSLGATDWADYKRRQGFIQGLERAINVINDVKRKAGLDDE